MRGRQWLAVILAALLSIAAACSEDAGDSAQPTTADSTLDQGRSGGETSDPSVDGTAGPTPTTGGIPTGSVGDPGTGEWMVVEPAEKGMDATTLEKARRYAFDDVQETQSVVVIRDGAIVAEWYAPDADPRSWAASWSMAKSFTSALIGIAIDEGLIESVDVLMSDYYPEWSGTSRAAIKLKDVLRMSSGLDFVEDYDPSGLENSDIIAMVLTQPDQLEYASTREGAREPGVGFQYSSGDTMLLSGVLEQATGMSAFEYAEEKLFGPLGIDQVEWWEDAAGHTLTYCCLDTTSRDFARFGLLFLNGGKWDGEQVVPAEWVGESLTGNEVNPGYGYQWWLIGRDGRGLPEDTFAALGHDGQHIYVIPSLDLVVVRNGTYIKYDGPPVADPNLYQYYPDDLVPDLGTRAPVPGWDDTAFLTPIIESIE